MMGLLIYKYEPLQQEVSVKSVILRWPFRPVGLLSDLPLSFCPSVCILFTFSFSAPKQLPQPTKLGTKHFWMKGIQVCSDEGSCPFPRADNYGIAKIHWYNLKILFSRTSGPISTKLGTKHPWVKGIYVGANEGPCPFPRADYYKIAKMQWRILKIFFSLTTGRMSTKLGKKHPWANGTQVCSNEGSCTFQGEIITKYWKYIDEI